MIILKPLGAYLAIAYIILQECNITLLDKIVYEKYIDEYSMQMELKSYNHSLIAVESLFLEWRTRSSNFHSKSLSANFLSFSIKIEILSFIIVEPLLKLIIVCSAYCYIFYIERYLIRKFFSFF